MTNNSLNAILNPGNYSGLELKTAISDSERVQQGREIAANTSIVICGLARDIREKLVKTIPRLEHIGNQFKKYKVIIFENDSSDGTRELLKEWAARNPNVRLLDCCQDGSCDCRLKRKSSYSDGVLSQDRITRMAEFRNRYLKVVKTECSDWDWLLVSDFDLEGPCSIDGLCHSLTFDNYDGIVLNGRFGVPGTLGLCTMTYDSLAYIDTEHTEIPESITYKDLVTKLLRMNYKISFAGDECIIPVKSAFNGMAVYRINRLSSSYYHPLGNCEHIGFHQKLRMGINKEWLCYVGFQGMRDFSDWIF